MPVTDSGQTLDRVVVSGWEDARNGLMGMGMDRHWLVAIAAILTAPPKAATLLIPG